MKIEHIAIWVSDLENMRSFYEKYFTGVSSDLYHNESKNFSSYFIKFSSDTRLEIMHITHLKDKILYTNEIMSGFAHLAFSVGSNQKVDELTNLLANDGYKVISFPRYTGDGYYESIIHDPENNVIEITN